MPNLSLAVDHHKSRQFSKNEVKTKIDNSEWTDTPADKQRKLEERLSGKKRSRDREEEEEPVKMSKRDIELRNQVESYNVSVFFCIVYGMVYLLILFGL